MIVVKPFNSELTVRHKAFGIFFQVLIPTYYNVIIIFYNYYLFISSIKVFKAQRFYPNEVFTTRFTWVKDEI